MATENAFSKLAEDLVLTIFFKLEEDPRDWARVACVCTKFSSLVRTVCWRSKCSSTIPSVVSDLLSASAAAGAPPPQVSWASLHKLAVCCPGLIHAGVLLENSDFGLERELGPDASFRRSDRCPRDSSSSGLDLNNNDSEEAPPAAPAPGSICSWSLFDDLYNDTLYSAVPETLTNDDDDDTQMGEEGGGEAAEKGAVKVGHAVSDCKRRRSCRSLRSHLASGAWNLCREQGNKLLASRFRGDCLYICDWPGCIHIEEKRNYMLFRGIFKNFKGSRVWRTINDGNRSKIDLNCAFCACKETWDLHSAFCLKRVFGFHDDGEPVVRAYVCENGHVSGAWTDRPLYT